MFEKLKYSIFISPKGHRMDDLQGIRKHKIGHSRKHKGSSTKVYQGKGDKPRRKYMTFAQKKKTFDHSPHEVFLNGSFRWFFALYVDFKGHTIYFVKHGIEENLRQ